MSAIEPNLYQQKLVNANNTVIIATDATESSVLNLGGASLLGLILPAAYTAGNITFKMSEDGIVGAFNNVKAIDGSGDAYTLAAVADDYLPVLPSVFAGCQWIQLVCSVAQAAQREIKLIMGPLWQ